MTTAAQAVRVASVAPRIITSRAAMIGGARFSSTNAGATMSTAGKTVAANPTPAAPQPKKRWSRLRALKRVVQLGTVGAIGYGAYGMCVIVVIVLEKKKKKNMSTGIRHIHCRYVGDDRH